MTSAYHHLEQRFAELSLLSDALGILGWDTQTQMPAGAAESRGAQVATLSRLSHERLTAPEVADWLDEAEAGTADPDPWPQANLREMRRAWRQATALPARLVTWEAESSTRCEMIWREARANSDFARLLPALADVLACQQEKAAALAAASGLSPYDALLDTYEEGLRSADIAGVFADLAAFLPPFLAAVLERQAAAPAPRTPEGPFPIAAQRALGETVMRAAGFDFSRGRLDVSLHPFCGGATDDVRITTRYNESDFASALMGVLHETGHALYEQNRPAAWKRQPVGGSRGMVVHESQSLLIEMQASRSLDFLTWLAPQAQAVFNGSGPAWSVENFARLYTRVTPGFIRVEADEVTYPAHILLRTRLEQELLAGRLPLADLPEAWNQGMQSLLGITPPDDRRGCLQDIHWPGGGWGYFPTYTLGAMVAAQLYATATAANPDIRAGLRTGDFAPLRTWLNAAIHSHGRRWPLPELLRQATGKPLDATAYTAHLKARYLEA